jgi:hypothetical protein
MTVPMNSKELNKYMTPVPAFQEQEDDLEVQQSFQKSDCLTSKDDATTETKKRLKLAQIKANMKQTKCVPDGTLKRIIDQVEEKSTMLDVHYKHSP